jgi:hypothetical protein
MISSINTFSIEIPGGIFFKTMSFDLFEIYILEFKTLSRIY